MACICGLAGVNAARETGQGCLVDLSLHEVMTSSIENLFFQWWFPDLLPIPQRALRQGSLHWLGAYVVADAKAGACNVAPVPQPSALFEWMAEEGDAEGAELAGLSIEEALAEMPRVMNAIRRFARTKDSGELFLEAQRRHIAFGEVQTVAQVVANPQYEFRGTFRAVDGFEQVRMPGPYARFGATPSPPQQPPPDGTDRLDALLDEWAQVPAVGADRRPTIATTVRSPPASRSPGCASSTSRGCSPARSPTASSVTSAPTSSSSRPPSGRRSSTRRTSRTSTCGTVRSGSCRST